MCLLGSKKIETKTIIDGMVVVIKTEVAVVRPSIIGLQYRVKNNSYVTLECLRNGVTGRLYGCVTEIVSDPYIAEVKVCRGVERVLCIKVRSLDSGLIYQVPFYKECIEETGKMQHVTILGRTLKVNDNSYSINLATMAHGNLFRQLVTIVSKPYLWFNPEFSNFHLMVDVVDERGNTWRVLFNEDGLIDKYNKTFCP